MKRMLGLAAAAILLAACEAKEAAPPPAAPKAAETLPADLRLAKAPEGAVVGVGALKKTAKEGQEVVLRAVVGGAVSPFVEGRAVMTVADAEAITSCAKMEMGADGC